MTINFIEFNVKGKRLLVDKDAVMMLLEHNANITFIWVGEVSEEACYQIDEPISDIMRKLR